MVWLECFMRLSGRLIRVCWSCFSFNSKSTTSIPSHHQMVGLVYGIICIYIYIISRVQFRICLVSYQLIHSNQLTWTINSQPRYCQYPLPFQKKSGGNSQISRIYNGFMIDLRSQIDRPRRRRPFVRSSGAWASSSAGR